jgi:C_GCAxxG_C_C family probable redox protein
VVLAVGEHLWSTVDDQIRRMTSGLAGGLGCGYEELCGALSGGTLVIGAQYGRTSPDQDDSECNRRVCAYREHFLREFGTTRCGDLRASGYGSDGQWPCSVLVERATWILWQVLVDQDYGEPER